MSSDSPPSGNQALIADIRAAMERAGGRLTFRDFMDLALYHPAHGYYSSPRPKTGKRGDYLTSPELTPLFGECVGRFLGQRGITRVLEIGAGAGGLAAALSAEFEYLVLERSSHAPLPNVTSVADVPETFQGAIISNELIDALPVHRVRAGAEVYVRPDFSEELATYSTPRIGGYFARLGLAPQGEAEVNLDALNLMRTVYERLHRGLVLTIDYGYEAEELFLRHPRGTLMTYAGHTSSSNPYDNIGEQDITSHVDFTSLMRLGEECGLRTEMLTYQADFLAQWGIGDLLLREQGSAEAASYVDTRLAVMELLNPAGMGGFRVLVQTKA